MILPTKQITKALISLRRWAGWSAPVLFANPKDRFSQDEAQIIDACTVQFRRQFDFIFFKNNSLNFYKILKMLPLHCVNSDVQNLSKNLANYLNLCSFKWMDKIY